MYINSDYSDLGAVTPYQKIGLYALLVLLLSLEGTEGLFLKYTQAAVMLSIQLNIRVLHKQQMSAHLNPRHPNMLVY